MGPPRSLPNLLPGETNAEAEKTARINEATGQAARFNKEYNEYVNYPLITKQRMFLETMSDVLPSLQVIIDQGNGEVMKYYPITELNKAAGVETSKAAKSASSTTDTTGQDIQ